MNADEIMAGIRSLEPQEFEKFLALIKGYVSQINAGSDRLSLKETSQAVPERSGENDGALARLADIERRERDAQSNME